MGSRHEDCISALHNRVTGEKLRAIRVFEEISVRRRSKHSGAKALHGAIEGAAENRKDQ